ncbi:hypothetical protein DFQ28_003932, partial [Apophysomyces sp. BC1034]
MYSALDEIEISNCKVSVEVGGDNTELATHPPQRWLHAQCHENVPEFNRLGKRSRGRFVTQLSKAIRNRQGDNFQTDNRLCFQSKQFISTMIKQVVNDISKNTFRPKLEPVETKLLTVSPSLSLHQSFVE